MYNLAHERKLDSWRIAVKNRDVELRQPCNLSLNQDSARLNIKHLSNLLSWRDGNYIKKPKTSLKVIFLSWGCLDDDSSLCSPLFIIIFILGWPQECIYLSCSHLFFCLPTSSSCTLRKGQYPQCQALPSPAQSLEHLLSEALTTQGLKEVRRPWAERGLEACSSIYLRYLPCSGKKAPLEN